LTRQSLLAAAALLAATAPALAGPLDAPPAAPPAVVAAPPADAFTGFYGALEFGTINGSVTSAPTSSFDGGITLGLAAGYNWQTGPFVFGGEVRMMRAEDFSWPAGAADAYRTLYDLRGRAGYAIGDFMVYGALGYSVGTFAPSTANAGDTDGLNFGIGMEYNVSDRFFLGADLTRRDLEGTNALGAVETEIDTLSLRGGLRF
jgi:outer membrane immunogenic protein